MCDHCTLAWRQTVGASSTQLLWVGQISIWCLNLKCPSLITRPMWKEWEIQKDEHGQRDREREREGCIRFCSADHIQVDFNF